MKRNIKRVLSLILVLSLVLGMMVNVYATDNTRSESGATTIADDDTDSDEDKTTESGLTISYGWHVANIETFTDSGETYVAAVAASTQAMATISSDYDNISEGYITAQYTSGEPGPNSSQTPNELGPVYGYNADVYYSDSTTEDGTTTYSLDDLNVKVYGSENPGTGDGGTPLTMTQSTGKETTKTVTNDKGTIYPTIAAYDENTIYSYDYITIVPENGYYVSQIVLGCAGSLKADAGSPYAETSENIAFTNENGNDDLFGAYGVGCTSMTAGSLTTASYDPTTGTSVELNMSDWIESHAEDTGVEDPYFILIEIEKIPTPLYVEYDAGDAAAYVSEATIVSTAEDYYWATETAGDNVSFALTSDDLTDIDYLYNVLDPAYTTYTDNDGTVYYFAGWEVSYYTTAEDCGTNESPTYPSLSGTVTLASSSISYGSGTELYLFTHVKLVAQWTTYTFDADYVVDFGLPVTLTVADNAALTTTTTDDDGKVTTETTKLANAIEGYTWSVQSVASNPEYGTASVSNGILTYTLNTVMEETDTMQVRMIGTYSGTNDTNAAVYSDRYAVVNVTIYPATTVYYEENFATYGTGTSVNTDSVGVWTVTSGSSTQQTHVACDTDGTSYYNYGYDDAYNGTTGASNSSEASTSTEAASLKFSFTGTGVDIYANCTSSTGTVLIRVAENKTDGDGNTVSTTVKVLTVNTADVGSYASADATSYNTPIASVTGLTYGNYTVTIYVYIAPFNFDGFRVYDTIENDETYGSEEAKAIQDSVYLADGEDYPNYTEIRDAVLTALVGTSSADDVTEDYVDSVTSGDTQVYTSIESGIAVYYSTASSYTYTSLITLMDEGAKNELYLPSGVTLVLQLDSDALGTDENDSESPRTIQVGVKSTSGTGNVLLSAEGGANSITVSTVDMFYTVDVDPLDDGAGYIVTINNSGSTTISLTKLKASDDVSVSSEAITESEITALLGGTDDTTEEEETVVFEPETLIVSTSVKTSSKSATVTVTVKASEDVESVIVNGKEVTSYKTVTERTGKGKNATVTTYHQFTYTETVTASGTYTYEVSAVNADGVASAAETASAVISIRSVGKK